MNLVGIFKYGPLRVSPDNLLDSNLEIFDFELSDDQMKAIDGLNLNERKLVPIITLTDGIKAPRDGKHKYYPYHEEY